MARWKPGIVFIGGETSGAFRRRFQAMGFETYSADVLPSEDGGEEMTFSDDGLPLGRHLVGDMFETLENLWPCDLWPVLGIFHPTCTYLTGAAEWAFADPDFARYPGVGYHQRVKPGTLTGAARREAREKAKDEFRQICALNIHRKVIENPVGALSQILKPSQIVQPFEHGDDASKKTCLWLLNRDNEQALEMRLPIDPAKRIAGRMVDGRERWSNQTDSGQNNATPADVRWKDRSRTFPGLADAAAAHWGAVLSRDWDM